MGEADWTELSGGLSSGSVARGVTTGEPRPTGGGSFVYGFASKDVSPGGVGLFVNLTDFAPMAKGGSIRGAIKRGLSGGALNFTPTFFIGLQGSSINHQGYLLGLQDDDPHRIVLRKGALSDGIPAGNVGTQGILRRSTATYANNTWLHLRLDMIANLNGDVILQCFQNVGNVTSPSWAAIAGMSEFVDDALGANSGSAPFTSGRGGFAFITKDVTRRAYFDHIELFRQN